jgi:Raf kinase inhibitor-like YbhB/YbcL family protein
MGFSLSKIQLISTKFRNGHLIPVKHSGEGDDVSPALSWKDPPPHTKSFAIFCHDPDAPLVSKRGNYGFVHWLLYNIPATTQSLKENCKEFTNGKNNFGKIGYNGPMPPEGHGMHHYFFWILALDVEPKLPEGLELVEFLEEVEPRILGMNRLMGVYQR